MSFTPKLYEAQLLLAGAGSSGTAHSSQQQHKWVGACSHARRAPCSALCRSALALDHEYWKGRRVKTDASGFQSYDRTAEASSHQTLHPGGNAP